MTLHVLRDFEGNYLVYLFYTVGKQRKKNLRGNWQEEDWQDVVRVTRTSKLLNNSAAINYKLPRKSRTAYLAENNQSNFKLGGGGMELYFHHSRRKVIQEKY